MIRHTIRWKLPGSRTFSSTTSEPRTHEERRYGPDPMGLEAASSSDICSYESLQWMLISVIKPNAIGFRRAMLICTRRSSRAMASWNPIDVKTKPGALPVKRFSGSAIRLKVYATSSAVSASPSWHVSPSRSV